MCKSVNLVAGTAAALLGALALAPAAQAQKAYPVVCNAGGGMTATVRPGNNVRVRFSRGNQAASTAPPSPGECTWLDRGFGSDEPDVLVVNGNEGQARYLIDAVRKGETFYAHIYNNRSGAMVVDRVGP